MSQLILRKLRGPAYIFFVLIALRLIYHFIHTDSASVSVVKNTRNGNRKSTRLNIKPLQPGVTLKSNPGETIHSSTNHHGIYTADWPSLDSRPLPKWFDSAKFGIFIHWGIYSVPSFYNEWFWWYWKGSKAKDSIKEFMKQNYPSVKKYTEFAQNFTAGKFVPDDWATLFRESGAKYVVFTTKHHEGFSNWPSKVHGNWNAATDGPHQDLVGAMATAVRKQNLTFGVYYSLFEWFSMNYQEDKKKNYASNEYVKHKVHPQLLELINTYKPDVLFSDGDFGPSNYWNATNFLAWLYNESPVKDTIVTNDRWGTDEVHNKHGDYFCPEHEPINTITHKWENCITLDKQSWGYRRNMVDSDVLTVNEVLTMLIRSISKGGNLLLNIGPTADGMIPQIFQQRLRKIGKWMQINGEGIYDSRPWIFHKDGANNVWYTRKGKYIYAFVLTEPSAHITLSKPTFTSTSTVILLDEYNSSTLEWNQLSDGSNSTLIKTAPYTDSISAPFVLRLEGCY